MTIEFVILALATWRITSLLYLEEGPYLMFDRLRYRVGVYLDDNGQRQARNELAKAFNCPHCLSVWVAALVALAYWLTTATVWLALPLALSAGSIIIETYLSRSSDDG